MVEQAQLELQLKVWKELAISKQMLMRTAAEALKLDPNCSQEELKTALDAALKKVAEADASVVTAREQAKSTILGMEQKLASAQKAQASSEAMVADLTTKLENATQQAAAARTSSAKEIQTLKDRVVEKDKQLKAINTALADTPENVLKKMNTLKKQRQEEADARREIETSFTTLRKEKTEQDQKLTKMTDSTNRLVTNLQGTARGRHQDPRTAEAAGPGCEGPGGTAGPPREAAGRNRESGCEAGCEEREGKEVREELLATSS